MAYTQVFGGSTIYPGDVSLLELALSENVALAWPLESAATEAPAARIIDVTASGAYTIALPDATKASPGQTILFNNLPASATQFFVVDAENTAVATVPIGTQWQVYLADNDDEGGTWRAYQLGASTASVQPSALAGYGIAAISGQLSQSMAVTTFSASPRTALLTDRASALVWTGSGAGTLNLPAATTAGNNYFLAVRNSGGGVVTIDPSGSEVIDGASTLTLDPGESATILTNGVAWYSLGLGREAVFAFDYTVINLTGQSSPHTLSGSELNRTAYKFIGVLTADMQIVVPPTIQQYWVDNGTTGAFNLTVKTASGSPVAVAQGARVILYCTGAEVVSADTGGVAVPISANQGGTGQVSYTIGDLLYASGATTLSRLADIATGNVLLSGGVGTAPAWGKVALATHVSGSLPLANGGTGGTDAATARTGLGLGTMATQNANTIAVTGGTAVLTSLAVNRALIAGTTSSLQANDDITLGGAGVNSLHFNGYYNAGYKYVAAGYSMAIRMDAAVGAMQFMASPASGVANAASSLVEVGRFDKDGNFGIGTTNPASPGANKNFVVNATGLSIIKSSGTTAARFDLSTQTANSYVLAYLQDNAGAPSYQLSCGPGVLTMATYFPLHVWGSQAGVEWLRMAGAGASATMTVNSKLLMQHDGTDAYIRPTNGGSSLFLGAANTNTLQLTLTATASSVPFSATTVSGNISSGSVSPVNGTSGLAALPSATFTNNGGGGSVFGIGSSITNGGNNTSSYHFAGVTQSVAIWYLYGNGTTSYTSDEKTKTNIKPARTDYLADIMRLQAVKFDRRAPEDIDLDNPGPRQMHGAGDPEPTELGLLAQDVAAVFPSLVEDAIHDLDGTLYEEIDEEGNPVCDEDGDPIMSTRTKSKVLKAEVIYGPIMLAAFQELVREVEDIKARLALLDAA